jgi:hypothetical protein
MALDVPIFIEPGQTRAIYVHSAARGDRGVRYQGFWSSKSMVSSASHIFPTDSRPWYDGFRISPAHLRPWYDGFEVFSHRFASVVRDSGRNTLSIRHSTPNALHCEALNPHRFNRLAKTIAYQYILARVTRRRFRLTLGTGGTGGIEVSLAPSTTASLFHLGLHRRTSTTLQNSKKMSSCCCWQTGWCKKPENPPP